MKKHLSRLLALLLIAALAISLVACKSNDTPTEPTEPADDATDPVVPEDSTLFMATGGTSGTYYAYGGAVAAVLQDKVADFKLTINVESTGASLNNINLVNDGENQIAIVQNDVMDYAYAGSELFSEVTDGFYAMAAAYAEVCQIVANPSAGINSVEDLRGKRVSVGDVGSGVEFNAVQILAAHGISFDDIDKQNLSFADSAASLKDNKIDAFFCTAGAPTTAITELTTTNDVIVLNVVGDAAATLVENHPFYTSYVIPGGTYKGVTDDVTTVAVKATFIVSKDLSDELVYSMTKALFENKGEVGHDKIKELDLTYAVEGISVPFHPGAAKYFSEQGITVNAE